MIWSDRCHLFFFIFLVLSLIFPPAVKAVDILQSLKISSRQNPENLNVRLDSEEKAWLQKKTTLRIAVWGDETPPFKIFPDSGSYEGITADYTQLITLNLGINADIIYFRDRQDAIDALQSGRIDMVTDGPGFFNNETGLSYTSGFALSTPVVVMRDNSREDRLTSGRSETVAVSRNYVSDELIRKFYPDSKIVRYPSDKSALSSVAFGESSIYVGNMVSAGFIIARNYTNTLSITRTLPDIVSGPHYVLRKTDHELLSSVNSVIRAIPDDRQRYLLGQWGGYPDPWRFQRPLELTGQEKKWLDQKKAVKVIVNPYFAPYTIMSPAGTFQGISADVIRMIHMRTGINFVPVSSSSVDGMFDSVSEKKGDFLAAMSMSEARTHRLNFTRPYISTPFVLIVRNVPGAPRELGNAMKVATTRDNIVAESLKREYPGVDFIIADNASLAMKMVDEGKADAALHNQLGADYMIERFFKNKLKISARVAEEPARVSFAVRWDEPELYSILDKALADIEPQDISLLVNKWQSMPDTPVSTWSNYSFQFYLLGFSGVMLLLIILLWNYFRSREIKRKLLSQKLMQDQLDFLDKLLDASPTPVYFIDNQYEVVKYNKSFSDFFTSGMDSVTSSSLFDTRHPLSTLLPLIQSAMDRGNDHNDVAIKNKSTISDGKNKRIISHWVLPHMDQSGGVSGLICGWIDITNYEVNLQHLNDQRKLAETASQAKSDYLATVSHEIRTQISPILGVLELEIINYPESENLKIAHESSRNLLELLGNVIDIAKIENGKIDLICTWTPLKNAIIPVVRVFEAVARQKGNSIRYNENNIDGSEVFLDISRFRQVMSNIISNAVKFTEKGEIDISVSASYVNHQSLVINVIVKDSGIGMTASDLEQLFIPFSRVGEGKFYSGSGLGLSISHQIIEAMGGELKVQSTYGIGTSVQVNIRVPVRHAVLYSPDTFLSETREKSLVILIVDDHPASRLVLKQQLSSLGHQVVECPRPAEAIRLMQSSEFDAVFTDCSMPDMDGYTFTQHIRASGSNVTVIGLTASAFASTRLRGIEAGMNECLFKPVSIPQLKEALKNIQLLATTFPLAGIIDLPGLSAMMHDNEAAISQLLQKVDEENTKDLALVKEHLSLNDWVNLSKCVHRIGGGAQIIHCNVVDQLCKRIELLCASPAYPHEIEKAINRLEIKLKILHSSISSFLAENGVVE